MAGSWISGVLLPFWGTALGAAAVFFLREWRPCLRGALSGAAAGIMLAAAFFSLLLPAIRQSAALGPWAFLPAAAGLSLGMGFVPALDALVLRFRGRFSGAGGGMTGEAKMILAVTLHNLPEGMAVGAVYSAWRNDPTGASLAAAWALALGIALQNVPEGAIVSLPLRAAGASRGRAFLGGALSGAVEPLGAAAVLLTAGLLAETLPVLLAFAAGAMLYVVLGELTPDLNAAPRGPAWFTLGFVLMMCLDVGLG